MDTEGIREVEAALEFGATAALQLGYASGSVLIRAGIYFRLAPGEGVELVGYVVVAGSMCMLGLITVTVRLHLALGYYKDGQTAELRGQASVTVKVEALFFSRSVTVTVERRFAGSADPLFIEVMPADSTWRQYADAFA